MPLADSWVNWEVIATIFKYIHLHYIWQLSNVCFEMSQALTWSPAVWPFSLLAISPSDSFTNAMYNLFPNFCIPNPTLIRLGCATCVLSFQPYFLTSHTITRFLAESLFRQWHSSVICSVVWLFPANPSRTIVVLTAAEQISGTITRLSLSCGFCFQHLSVSIRAAVVVSLRVWLGTYVQWIFLEGSILSFFI